jgi:hypothetical protein
VGHAAASVANAIALEASRHEAITFHGQFPEDPDAREIIVATGLPKVLGVSLPWVKGFKTFELRHGRARTSTARRSPERDIIGSELTRYVNDCLGDYGWALSATGRANLGGILGEVLANAEEHSGRPHWWISGYLRQRGTTYGDCHITIFNFGKTLAESLQGLPADALLRRQIEGTVSRHSKKHRFQRGWTEEGLWTLYALQEGVSRKNVDPGIIRNRGQGLPDLITFFQKLGQLKDRSTAPTMFILSGHTQILFTGEHEMQLKELEDGSVRRVIAFNKENDLNEPPAPDAVKNLNQYFPGVLVGMDFYFDKDYLDMIGGKK